MAALLEWTHRNNGRRQGADAGAIPMTLSEFNGWLGALGALLLFVYLGHALLRPERF